MADMRQFTPDKGLWGWKGRLTWGAFNNPEMRLGLSPGAGMWVRGSYKRGEPTPFTLAPFPTSLKPTGSAMGRGVGTG